MALKSGKYTVIDLVNFKKHKVACLTLDVEQDYGELLDKPSYEGLEYIQNLVDFFKESGVPLTCFVQGSLLETHPAKIEQLYTLDTEFELHSYSHPKPQYRNTDFEIVQGKKAYIDFFHKWPIGYRAPCGFINMRDYETLVSNGFEFDSSIFPSLRPGVFNNLNKPTGPYSFNDSGMVEFPITVVSNLIRIPMSLSYIKLLGKPYFYLLRNINLPNLIIFSFHLHDLFELSSSDKLPVERADFIHKSVFKRIYQKAESGLPILSGVIEMLQDRGYAFMKLVDVYKTLVTI